MTLGFFKDLLGPGETCQASVSEKASVNEHGASDLRHIKDCRWRKTSL